MSWQYHTTVPGESQLSTSKILHLKNGYIHIPWMISNKYSMVELICQHLNGNLSNHQKTGITNGQGIQLEHDITLIPQKSKPQHLVFCI